MATFEATIWGYFCSISHTKLPELCEKYPYPCSSSYPFFNGPTRICTLGAIWYYQENSWIGQPGIATARVTGIDTLLGHACKRIELNSSTSCSDCNGILHVYEENGKVYRAFGNSFHLFMDFTAMPGDTWRVASGLPFITDSLDVHVESISWIYLGNGDSLRVQHVSYETQALYWGAQIIECLGSEYFLCPQVSVCDPHIFPLLCYADPNFQQPFDCIPHIATHAPVSIFQKGLLRPNPAAETVFLPADFDADAAVFFNTLGGQQKMMPFSEGRQLTISTLAPGVYTVQFLKNGALIALDKLVILKNGN